MSTLSMSWPATKPETPTLGPFEMDAVESEYNPWLHAPMPMVGRVPHRWEKTLGTDRMFFDAEHDLFPRRKKRRQENEDSARDTQRRRRDRLSVAAELPAVSQPTELFAPTSATSSVNVNVVVLGVDENSYESQETWPPSVSSDLTTLEEGEGTHSTTLTGPDFSPITPLSANPFVTRLDAPFPW